MNELNNDLNQESNIELDHEGGLAVKVIDLLEKEQAGTVLNVLQKSVATAFVMFTEVDGHIDVQECMKYLNVFVNNVYTLLEAYDEVHKSGEE